MDFSDLESVKEVKEYQEGASPSHPSFQELLNESFDRPIEGKFKGKTVILYKGKAYSEQFRWFLILNNFLDKGYKLRCFYRDGEVRDKPTKMTMDLDNGVAPELPRHVEVLQQVQVQDNLSEMFGARVEEKVVMDIENVQTIDPSVNESLDIIGLVL